MAELDFTPKPNTDPLDVQLYQWAISGESSAFYREMQLLTQATKVFGLDLSVWDAGHVMWNIMLVHPDYVQLGIWEMTKQPAGQWKARMSVRNHFAAEFGRWWQAVYPELQRQRWFDLASEPTDRLVGMDAPPVQPDADEIARRRIVAREETVTLKRLRDEKETIECEQWQAQGFSPDAIADKMPHLSVDTIRRRLRLKE